MWWQRGWLEVRSDRWSMTSLPYDCTGWILFGNVFDIFSYFHHMFWWLIDPGHIFYFICQYCVNWVMEGFSRNRVLFLSWSVPYSVRGGIFVMPYYDFSISVFYGKCIITGYESLTAVYFELPSFRGYLYKVQCILLVLKRTDLFI